jgi:hypothetical protein
MEVGAVAELIAGLMFAAHKNPGDHMFPPASSRFKKAILISVYLSICGYIAIGAAQTVLFMLENSDPKAPGSHMNRAVEESRAFMKKFDTGILSEGSFKGQVSVLDTLEVSCPAIRSATQEALRLTGHTIGAIRKVMPEEGWKVDAGNGQTYHIPHGSYVGVSHIVPNITPKR